MWAPIKAVTSEGEKVRICSTEGTRNEVTKHLNHTDSLTRLHHADVWLSPILLTGGRGLM